MTEKKLWRNQKERKEWGRRLQAEGPGLEVVHSQAAGIDVGNGMHYVAVRPDREQRSDTSGNGDRGAVIQDGGTMSAAGALIEMTTECGGTTPANGQQHFDVLPTEPVAISFAEGTSRGANQIGRLEWWPGHLLFLWRTAFERQ